MRLIFLAFLLPALPAHALDHAPLPGHVTRTDDSERALRQTAIVATLTLKVAHPDQVRKQAIDLAKQLGGFPTLVTDTQLDLKIPPQHVDALLTELGHAGLVLGRTLQRGDRTEIIADLQARLKTKREVFQRLRTFLDDSNVAATLKVERSMSALVSDLENLRGQLEMEEQSVRNAVVRVSFQYRREARIDEVRSPFDWLNTVDVERFMRDF